MGNGHGKRRWLQTSERRTGEVRMTKMLRLICTAIAAAGLMRPASHSFAQQPDQGDQPGLVADDSYELDPEWQKQMVYFRTTEPPGTIIISTAERHLYLLHPGGPARRYGVGVGRVGFPC